MESVISVNATDAVGPTRLRLLTAGSTRLPVAIVAGSSSGDTAYYLLDVATLQAALTNQLSATSIADTIDLDSRAAGIPVSKLDAKTAPAGSPVVEDGRLIGVIAEDLPERKEPTEADMSRGADNGSDNGSDKGSGAKRGLWKRLSRSAD